MARVRRAGLHAMGLHAMGLHAMGLHALIVCCALLGGLCAAIAQGRPAGTGILVMGDRVPTGGLLRLYQNVATDLTARLNREVAGATVITDEAAGLKRANPGQRIGDAEAITLAGQNTLLVIFSVDARVRSATAMAGLRFADTSMEVRIIDTRTRAVLQTLRARPEQAAPLPAVCSADCLLEVAQEEVLKLLGGDIAPRLAQTVTPIALAARPAAGSAIATAARPSAPPRPVDPAALGRDAFTRVALVIGNGAYAAVGKLDNPTRDADAVAATFRSLNFKTVTVAKDLTRAKMLEAIEAFSREAGNADYAVIYFAGHGIEINGQNYLIPVDAALRRDRNIPDETVPLNRLLDEVQGARKLRLVILDACRDNPFLPKMERTAGATRSVTRGLAAAPETTPGTLIWYAAQHGRTASDGSGQDNSPFVQALLRHVATPGLDLRRMFSEITSDVQEATGNEQTPHQYGTLPRGDFLLSAARRS
jgi:hypothetical protein